MSVLVKKLYFDIYNLENDLKNKEQIIQEYQKIFEEYILKYKEENNSFANTYNEIEELNKKVVQKEFEKTINSIEQQLNTDSSINSELSKENKSKNSKEKKLESITKNYRDIVKITHPDKTLSLDSKTQIEYEDYYKKATFFYDNNELYGLMLINKLLGNNPFNVNFIDADIDNLKSKKQELENKIKDIQESFTWNFMNIEDEKELNNFITNHFKNMLNKMK